MGIMERMGDVAWKRRSSKGQRCCVFRYITRYGSAHPKLIVSSLTSGCTVCNIDLGTLFGWHIIKSTQLMKIHIFLENCRTLPLSCFFLTHVFCSILDLAINFLWPYALIFILSSILSFCLWCLFGMIYKYLS